MMQTRIEHHQSSIDVNFSCPSLGTRSRQRTKAGRTTSYMKWLALVVVCALFTTGCERSRTSAEGSSGDASVPTEVWVYSSQVNAGDTNQSYASRPIYPFSLVPGGVYSASELSRALGVSKSLRAHYADINFKNLHLSRVEKDTPAYVSYRRGGTIYWTRHRLTLRSGELVLTDGKHLVRARCANQISLVPQEPVEVEASPVVENQLETPVDVAPLQVAAVHDFDSEFRPTTSAVSSESGAPAPQYVGWGSVATPNLYAVCTGCSNVSTNSSKSPTTKPGDPPTLNPTAPPESNPPGPPSSNPPGPPNDNPPGSPTTPVPVPEPGSAAMLATAVALMGPALLRARRR
jgi:hypothetical protein